MSVIVEISENVFVFEDQDEVSTIRAFYPIRH